MAITKRTGLGRPLTHAEMDANFEELRTERAGTAITGSNTYDNDQFITGSIKVSSNISGSSLNVSDDIYLGDKLYDRTDTNTYLDLGSSQLLFNQNGTMMTIKSGSGITIGNSVINHNLTFYSVDTSGLSSNTGSTKFYGTANFSGSDYIASASVNNAQLVGLKVTGSIIPEGSGSHDLGSEDNPFKDLYITSASLKLVDFSYAKGDVRRVTNFSKDDMDNLKKGKSIQKIDEAGAKLAVAKIGALKAVGTSTYAGITDTTAKGAVGIHSTGTISGSQINTDHVQINGGGNLYYNPSTNTLTAGTFSGSHSGNVKSIFIA